MILKRTVRPAVESRRAMLARTEAEIVAEVERREALNIDLYNLLVQVDKCEAFERNHPLTVGSSHASWRHL